MYMYLYFLYYIIGALPKWKLHNSIERYADLCFSISILVIPIIPKTR